MPSSTRLYYGTGNPGPWNAEQRPGDNKWTAGIFARDPATGAAHWYYQMNPHDEHDYDGVNEQMLLDMPFGGSMHKVLIHLDRNGYVYVIDRTNGQVLSADPYRAGQFLQGRRSARPGGLIVNPEKETKLGQADAQHLPDRLGRQGLESRPASAPRPACSTSRTRTCAWTG